VPYRSGGVQAAMEFLQKQSGSVKEIPLVAVR